MIVGLILFCVLLAVSLVFYLQNAYALDKQQLYTLMRMSKMYDFSLIYQEPFADPQLIRISKKGFFINDKEIE